jgi:hypothetical protein
MAIKFTKLTENGTMQTAVLEQRTDTRSELAWPVSIWLPEASRFFNGKSVNISKSGTYLSVPLTTPVREGHDVEINFPRTASLAKEKGRYARIKTGRVVRVDRKSMLDSACIGLAVEFV